MPGSRVLAVGLTAPAAWLLAGCGGSSGDLISTVALPSQQTTAYADAEQMPMAVDSSRLSGTPQLTPAQQQYLAALAEAGIRPSNELRTLGIGAYVCQARAAGQSDQAVWDSVAPMVRSVVVPANTAAPESGPPMDVDAVVDTVIRVATGKLC